MGTGTGEVAIPGLGIVGGQDESPTRGIVDDRSTGDGEGTRCCPQGGGMVEVQGAGVQAHTAAEIIGTRQRQRIGTGLGYAPRTAHNPPQRNIPTRRIKCPRRRHIHGDIQGLYLRVVIGDGASQRDLIATDHEQVGGIIKRDRRETGGRSIIIIRRKPYAAGKD